ncbi:carbohydrate ABC transporter permease [Paenibacillus thalictri]|uniref:Carbohydrate ABC transporter permease n=1 Tax=Paenibacillus thalictri TaxID=2527873 RepID=A0A4Q9DT98_9BACL|nr:carbohydrate ABC transporter permease [Paenibacillus thalictri]TBL79355.1 carbohydrate ABC transporter permease [Paenibacillus thalictri]
MGDVHVKTKARTKSNLGKLLMTLLVSVLGILMLLPFLWMVSASLKQPNEVFQFPIRWIPAHLQFTNYKEVWLNKYYPFSLFFFNSLKVTAITIIGTLLVSAAAAYAFAKIEFRWKNAIFLVYLTTLMIPHQVTLVPRFILFHWLGVYDTHWTLILPGMFNIIGIFLLRQFFMGIPKDFSESAFIDGARHATIFWRIVIPLATPGFVSLIILSFVWNWNNYMDPLIFLTSKQLYTIPVGLQTLLDQEGIRTNLVMAGATCSVLPIMIVFLLFQKHFIQGIASSGIKG